MSELCSAVLIKAAPFSEPQALPETRFLRGRKGSNAAVELTPIGRQE